MRKRIGFLVLLVLALVLVNILAEKVMAENCLNASNVEYGQWMQVEGFL